MFKGDFVFFLGWGEEGNRDIFEFFMGKNVGTFLFQNIWSWGKLKFSFVIKILTQEIKTIFKINF